jgi:hypothetical protein
MNKEGDARWWMENSIAWAKRALKAERERAYMKSLETRVQKLGVEKERLRSQYEAMRSLADARGAEIERLRKLIPWSVYDKSPWEGRQGE